jgi:hypothetical protein
MGGRFGGVGGERSFNGDGVERVGGRLISSCDSRRAVINIYIFKRHQLCF